MRAKPGHIIILEGVDNAGKSTQARALEAIPWEPPAPLFTHMPSGLTPLTRAVYDLTEDVPIGSPLARQLLHLACHGENIDALLQAAQHQTVIIDRWWWSTVAYGWYGARLDEVVPGEVFFGLIRTIWGRLEPDAIFLFLTPYLASDPNLERTVLGYRALAAERGAVVAEVPVGEPDSTTAWLLTELSTRGLIEVDGH